MNVADEEPEETFAHEPQGLPAFEEGPEPAAPNPIEPEPIAASPAPAPRRNPLHHVALLLLLFATWGAGRWFIAEHPTVAFRGDEEPYARIACESYADREGVPSFLPGAFGLHYWPPLSFALYGLFTTPELEALFADAAVRGLEEPETGALHRAMTAFLPPLAELNLLFLLVAAAATYGLALALGAGPWSAAFGAALLTLNPRVVFYVQALWPELLHFALFLPALLLLAVHLRLSDPRRGPRARAARLPLFLAALLFVYAALTKGIAGLYLWVLLALYLLWNRRALLTRPVLLTLATLFLTFHVPLLVQRASNLRSDGEFAISSNTWVNIEKGLIPNKVAVDLGFKNTSERYARAAEDLAGREAASRERVFEYLRTTPLGLEAQHLLQQLRELPGGSFLQKGLYTGRWSDPAGLLTLEAVAAALSWATVVLGFLGALATWRRGRAPAALAAFLAYYLGALVVVGWNERFLVQALPVLAAFAACVLARLFAPPATEPAT